MGSILLLTKASWFTGLYTVLDVAVLTVSCWRGIFARTHAVGGQTPA